MSRFIGSTMKRQSSKSKGFQTDTGPVVILGDSYSDDGNCFNRLAQRWPRGCFERGCFTDDLTWAGLFKQNRGGGNLKNREVLNLAHGGASVKAKVLRNGVTGTPPFTGVPLYHPDANDLTGIKAKALNLQLEKDMAAVGARLEENATEEPKFVVSVPSIRDQIKEYLYLQKTGVFPHAIPKTTFVLFAGSSDYINTYGTGQKSGDAMKPEELCQALLTHLKALEKIGARRLIVADVPPLSASPFCVKTGTKFDDQKGSHSMVFKHRLAGWADRNKHVQVRGWAVYDLLNAAIEETLTSKVGKGPCTFDNVTKPMLVGDPYVDPDNCELCEEAQNGHKFLWLDDLHVTSTCHELLYESFMRVFTSADVPNGNFVF